MTKTTSLWTASTSLRKQEFLSTLLYFPGLMKDWHPPCSDSGMQNTANKERVYQNAENYFRRLLQIDGGDADARFALAATLLLRGQIAQAEEQFFRLLLNQNQQKTILFQKTSFESKGSLLNSPNQAKITV